MTHRRISFGLAGGMVLLSSVALAQRVPLSVPLSTEGYEQISRKLGVTVYKHRTSDIITLGADAVIQAPPDEVLRAVLDYKGQVGVVKRLSESRVLASGPGWLRVYQRLNLPVIDDRDFTLHVAYWNDGGTRWVSYRVAPRVGPAPRPGIVRVAYHSGSWQMVPTDGGRATRVRFMTSIDMGGWLPKWLARSGSGKEVPEVFASMRQLVAKHIKQSNRRLASWSSN